MHGTFEVRFDACRLNGRSKKPTSLLTNCRSLYSLEQKCPGISSSHQHEPLQGAKKVLCCDGKSRWLSRTKLAGAYTHSLRRAWSLAIQRAPPPSVRSKSLQATTGVPEAEVVAALHAAMPRATREAESDVLRCVRLSLNPLILSSFNDDIAEADLYELADTSASGSGPDFCWTGSPPLNPT